MQGLNVDAATRIAFLTHSAFTPRTRLYFTNYASLLKPLKNIDLLFAAALNAVTEADAQAYVAYVRMLAYSQLQHGQLTEVITASRFPTIATSDGHAVLALPIDYLAWTAAVAEAADALHSIRQARGLDLFVVLLAGSLTERASKELAARAVDVQQYYSY